MVLLKLLVPLFASAAALPDDGRVVIATFDGALATTRTWGTLDDTVMGGVSGSRFSTSGGLGIWKGEVRLVPRLQKPGFCTVATPPRNGQPEAFPDLSHTIGLGATLRSGGEVPRVYLNLMLSTVGATQARRDTVYVANVSVGEDMRDVRAAWDAFTCSWHGQLVDWCPPLRSQLATVERLSIGTWGENSFGVFQVALEGLWAEVSAPSEQQDGFSAPSPNQPPRVLAGDEEAVDLSLFDATEGHPSKLAQRQGWHIESDPVMGGVSKGSWAYANNGAVFSGDCRIVPKLKAPGFVIALSRMPLFGFFPSVEKFDGIRLKLTHAKGNLTSFKFAFCDSRFNPFRCQFQNYKAGFELKAGVAGQLVHIPWDRFTDKWSPSTGEPTAESPPGPGSLRSLTQLQLWAEGEAGDFELHVHSIAAYGASARLPVGHAVVVV